MTLAVAPIPASDTLLREDDSGIAILSLNRPEARNSLSEALLHALEAELTASCTCLSRSLRRFRVRPPPLAANWSQAATSPLLPRPHGSRHPA